MTLTELRYIVALSQTRHFGRAAKRCCVSQPTLSIGIQKIEEELGVALFERVRNEVYVTKMGEQLVAQAQRVLEEIEKFKTIATAGKNQLNEPLKIGVIFTIAPYLFPTLIPQLKKVAPTMPLFVIEDYTAHLRSKLRNGEVDAIFISLPFTETDIVTKKLYEEDFVVLMRKDHPLSQQTEITLLELEKENILLLGSGHCFRDQVLAACSPCLQEGTHQQTVEGASLETLRHMVASGFGITVLPESATQIKHYHHILCT